MCLLTKLLFRVFHLTHSDCSTAVQNHTHVPKWTSPQSCLVTLHKYIQKWTYRLPPNPTFLPFPFFKQMALRSFWVILEDTAHLPEQSGRRNGSRIHEIREKGCCCVCHLFRMHAMSLISEGRLCVCGGGGGGVSFCLYLFSVEMGSKPLLLQLSLTNFNHYRDFPIWLSFLLSVSLRCSYSFQISRVCGFPTNERIEGLSLSILLSSSFFWLFFLQPPHPIPPHPPPIIGSLVEKQKC